MSYPEPERPVASVAPADLKRRLDAGERVHLLDTRNRSEIEEWRIAAPVRTDIPYMKFQAAEITDTVADLVADALDPAETVVVVCAEGKASAYVASLLDAAGYDAANLAGGMHGWARLSESFRLTEAGADPLVVQFVRPSSGCLSYLVVSGDEAAVVDPLRAFADRYREAAADHGATLRYALDTHVHADHVSGVRTLADEAVEPVMGTPAVDRGVVFDVRTLDDGASLSVGETTVSAVAAPGHTTGMTAFRVGDLLLSGDGLFLQGVPRPDLQATDEAAADYARTLHATLTERLAGLPDDVRVAPGHVEGTGPGPHVASLGDLRERLPVFGWDRETFVERVLAGMGPQPGNYERIIAVNLGRAEADGEEAFELELGPNNCAATAD